MKLHDKADVAPQVMSRVIGSEVVLLDLVAGTYFGLNAVGARCWELLKQGHSLAEVCNMMETEFDVERPTLEADLLSLVDELLARGLVLAQTAELPSK